MHNNIHRSCTVCNRLAANQHSQLRLFYSKLWVDDKNNFFHVNLHKASYNMISLLKLNLMGLISDSVDSLMGYISDYVDSFMGYISDHVDSF